MIKKTQAIKHEFYKRLLAFLCVVAVCSSFTNVLAWLPYASFHYIYKEGELVKVSCPAPFIVNNVLNMNELGFVNSMPNDIFVTKDGSLYLVDTAASSVIIIGSDKLIKGVISEFTINGEKNSLNKPEGVFVTNDNGIYIADTENNRIVEFNKSFEAIRIIKPEKNETLGNEYIFYPRKVVVDSTGRIFTVARGQFNGIMQFTREGVFSEFIGSNLVTTSPIELFIKKFMTKEQREKMTQYIPLEYSNLYIDQDDFIYAVTQATNETQKVKRLSPGGTDVLMRDNYYSLITEKSKIVDICTDEYENHYYIDNTDGCIYAYNTDGSLLYAFGGNGDQEGTYKNPSSIAYNDGTLYVTDSVNRNITIYDMSEYAKNIKNANNLYNSGEYEKSREIYLEVLKKDANFELANVYLGRIYYRMGEYKIALDYFKKGNFRGDDVIGGYGAALEQYRAEILRKNLPFIFSSLVIIVLISLVFILLKKKLKKGGKWK